MYLVTGGCGFIGSHLAHALVNMGEEVVILDDLSTGKLENAPKVAKIIIGDATDYTTVEKAFVGIKGCFHLAAIASVQKSITDWQRTHTVNVTACVNVFQAAILNKIPVVYTSSAAVYGDNTNIPLSEDAAIMPLTAYGADKFGCELHGRVAWLVHRVPTIGLRPFNVYGPKQDPSSPYSGVISIFTDRISRKQPITIFGDGEQVRDFIYVSDVVRAFIAAMGKMAKIGEGSESNKSSLIPSVFNLCTGKATSLNQLTNTIEKICGWQVDKQYSSPRSGDITQSLGNPSKLNQQLNIKAEVSLEEGLRIMHKFLTTCY